MLALSAHRRPQTYSSTAVLFRAVITLWHPSYAPLHALIVTIITYDIFFSCVVAVQDEFEGEIPPYPYMRIRTRETFPWGNDQGLFEKHQHVHPQ